MKKILLSAALLIFASTVLAQSITVKFTARSDNGQYHSFDSIRVENVSQGWSQRIAYPDTVLTLGSSESINVAEAFSNVTLKVYPNPFAGYTSTIMQLNEDDEVNISILRINGSVVSEYKNFMSAGVYALNISLAEPQVAFLSVSTRAGRSVAKIVNTKAGSSNNIEVLHQGNVTHTKAVGIGPFSIGEQMRYTAVSISGAERTLSTPVTQAQTASGLVTLVFVESNESTIPVVSTSAISNVTSNSATCGGSVSYDGGQEVTARGVCWSTSHNPTTADNHTTDGTGMGSFTSTINGLSETTTYYVRAYATNSIGTAYGEEITFTTSSTDETLPTVTTSEVTDITATTATCGGNVTDSGSSPVTDRGVCWSTSHNPTTADSHTNNGTRTGVFTSFINGLSDNTTYYVRAYATNSVGTAYGEEVSFTTLELTLPTVTTSDVEYITKTTALCGGNVTNGGNSPVTARGVCWSTSHNPTTADSYTTDGADTGSFTSGITRLSGNTTYYVRAFATNSAGTAYGEEKSFTTKEEPFDENGESYSVFTISPGITVHFSKGNLQYKKLTDTWRFAEHQNDTVTGYANYSQTDTGWMDLFGWGTSGWNSGAGCYQPWVIDGQTGCYGPSCHDICDLTGNYANADWGVYNAISNGGDQTGWWRTLTYEEWYYLLNSRYTSLRILRQTRYISARYTKAKVSGINGLIIFPDIFAMPDVINENYFNSDSSPFIGNLTESEWSQLEDAGCVFLPAAGGRGAGTGNINYWGLYWSTTHANYSGDEKCSYLMIFGSDILGLTFGARNCGMSVRLVHQNATQISLPTVSTSPAGCMTTTTAICGGNITDNGGSMLTARGVCWSTSHNPTTSDNHTSEESGLGPGTFENHITGLTKETTYYVRAYATNSVGTAYGEEVSFTTTAEPFDENNASNAIFSIDSGYTVKFSHGNLQYKASNNTWRFAENQYDYVGEGNSNISSTYTGWIDLFGWGTSGWNSGANAYQPWATNTTPIDYYPNGNYNNNLTGDYANADWGVYNRISNGGNQAGMWRTLTHDEWRYLLYSRAASTINGTENARYVKATIDSIKGLIIFPDNFTMPSGISYPSEINTHSAPFNSNIYTELQWKSMECAGCVFLPTSGIRYDTEVSSDMYGYYWTKTHSRTTDKKAYSMVLGESYMRLDEIYRGYGLSVRLVQGEITRTLLPTVTTSQANNIEGTTATYGGNVTSSGDLAITARGVCWNTSNNPTTSNNHTSDGTGTGTFTSTISGLAEGTTYYVRAYATNSIGTAYGEEMSFTTKSVEGFDNNGASYAVFSVDSNKTIHFSRGNLQFQASTSTWRFAECQYDYIGDDNQNISSTYTGWIDLFGWGTSGWHSGATAYRPWDTIKTNSYYRPDGTGNNNLTGEYANADWGVYNRISNGGNQAGMWRTLTKDEWNYLLNSRTASTINGTENARYVKARVNGVYGLIIFPDNFTIPSGISYPSRINNGSANYFVNTYTEIQWRQMEEAGCIFLPDAGHRSGALISNSYGHYWTSTAYDENNAYDMRLYDINTDYYSFRFNGLSVRLVTEQTTQTSLPTVTTSTVSNITSSSATCGGNVTHSGNATITARGVCWSTSHNPTTANNHTSNGTGSGSFTSTISGLTANTTYYVRAYATNSEGTAYGEEQTFTTSENPTLPTVTTSTVGNITSSSATCGGNVTHSGNATITARGVCWSTSHNPTTANSHTTNGTGTGSFTSSISGLTDNTTYYVRAYATNSAGTAYGEEMSFTTPTTTYYTITVASSNSTMGSVTGGGTYASGTTATITATPNSGYHFSQWQDGNTSNPRTITISSNATYTAYFDVNQACDLATYSEFTISSPVEYGGTITGTCGFANIGTTSFTGYLGVAAYNSSNTLVAMLLQTSSTTFESMSSGILNISKTATSPLVAGTYTARAVYSTDGSNWIHITNGYDNCATSVSFTVLQPSIGGFDNNNASNAVFTVASGRTVHFSKGNLQYQASSNTWRFAEHQYDYIGEANSNISSTYSGWIDLFGWGTSGWNSGANAYQPWATSTTAEDYYPGGSNTNNLTGEYANADWGVYNAISNGGNQAGIWRTLTINEWIHLLNSRAASTINGTANARYAKAVVNGTCGLIIFPDYFVMPSGLSYPSGINSNTASFNINTYTESQWEQMENAGCIFIPTAGYRLNTSVTLIDVYSDNSATGIYWSSTSSDNSARNVGLGLYDISFTMGYRYYALSVRLVKD